MVSLLDLSEVLAPLASLDAVNVKPACSSITDCSDEAVDSIRPVVWMRRSHDAVSAIDFKQNYGGAAVPPGLVNAVWAEKGLSRDNDLTVVIADLGTALASAVATTAPCIIAGRQREADKRDDDKSDQYVLHIFPPLGNF